MRATPRLGRFAARALAGLCLLAACHAPPAATATADATADAAVADVAPDTVAVADMAPAVDVALADAAVDVPPAADAAPLADAVSADAAVAEVADAAPVDVAPADVPAAAPDAAVGEVVDVTPITTISVTTTVALGPGLLHVRLIDYSTPTCEPTPADIVIVNAAMPLPAEVTVAVPPGVWMPTAAWLDPKGKVQVTSPFGGTGTGLLTVLPGQYAPAKLSLVINTPVDKSTCTAPPANTFLATSSAYVIPFTNLGVTHLLEGLAWNGSWWMAANVDGLGRVNLPSNGKGVEGWSPVPIGDCRHLTRDGTRLYCTERGPTLKWLDVDAATNATVAQGQLALGTGLHAEGLQATNGKLYVTLHEAGVGLLPLPAAGVPTVYAQGLVADAWQVAVLADGKVVVADGAAGLKVLAPFSNGKTSVLSALPLPGLCAHLAVDGQTVAVGALGGGLHMVQVDAAGKATLLGTLPAGPWPVAGVDLHGAMAYIAAGRALLAVPVPNQPVGLLSAVSATLTESFMSLDVHAAGSQAYTAEYAYVRALQLDPTPPPPGPVVVQEQETWTKLGAVGAAVTFETWVWNAGSAPLELTKAVVSLADGTPLPAGASTAPPPQTIAPGQTGKLTAMVTKTAAAPQQWRLNVMTNDPARQWVATTLTESPLCREGDPLPALALDDKAGTLHTMTDLAGGKPLLIIVSAETCPVAFERAAALVAHAQPWLTAGKLVALNINPTDDPTMKEVGGYKFPFIELFAILTVPLVMGWSGVSDGTLALPGEGPIPPLPLVYLVDPGGTVTYAHLGYAPVAFGAALEAVAGKL